MNETVNKLLLAGDRFMPEMHLRQPDLQLVFVDNLLKANKEHRNLKKQKIQYMHIKTN